MFLGHFFHLLLEGGDVGLQFLIGGLLFGKVAGNDECGRNQFSLVFLLADNKVGLLLGLLGLVLDDQPGLGCSAPAIGGDEVAIVLHGLGPVVHEVLVDVVMVEQGRLGERSE